MMRMLMVCIMCGMPGVCLGGPEGDGGSSKVSLKRGKGLSLAVFALLGMPVGAKWWDRFGCRAMSLLDSGLPCCSACFRRLQKLGDRDRHVFSWNLSGVS